MLRPFSIAVVACVARALFFGGFDVVKGLGVGRKDAARKTYCSRFTRADEATDFNPVKSQSRASTPRMLNVVQLPSVYARTKADRKRSD